MTQQLFRACLTIWRQKEKFQCKVIKNYIINQCTSKWQKAHLSIGPWSGTQSPSTHWVPGQGTDRSNTLAPFSAR